MLTLMHYSECQPHISNCQMVVKIFLVSVREMVHTISSTMVSFFQITVLEACFSEVKSMAINQQWGLSSVRNSHLCGLINTIRTQNKCRLHSRGSQIVETGILTRLKPMYVLVIATGIKPHHSPESAIRGCGSFYMGPHVTLNEEAPDCLRHSWCSERCLYLLSNPWRDILLYN